MEIAADSHRCPEAHMQRLLRCAVEFLVVRLHVPLATDINTPSLPPSGFYFPIMWASVKIGPDGA